MDALPDTTEAALAGVIRRVGSPGFESAPMSFSSLAVTPGRRRYCIGKPMCRKCFCEPLDRWSLKREMLWLDFARPPVRLGRRKDGCK